MNSKLLYNQIKEQLPPMEGVAVKVEDINDKIKVHKNYQIKVHSFKK